MFYVFIQYYNISYIHMLLYETSNMLYIYIYTQSVYIYIYIDMIRTYVISYKRYVISYCYDTYVLHILYNILR